MNFIGDYVAEFKRGKDKKPRKKRNPYVQAAAYGVLGDTAVDTGSAIGSVVGLQRQAKNRFIKTGKATTPEAAMKIMKRQNLIGPGRNVRSLKAYGAGAAVGLGGYSAYRLAKNLRDRRRKK